MPRVPYARLLDTLRRPPPGVAVFLYGDEDYLREEAASRAVELLLDPATRDFNFDQLRGSDASADELASLLATPPMMAERRVVVVRDAQGLSNRAREVLEATVASPPPGLALVVSATIPQGSKAKFYSQLQKHAMAIEFPRVDALDLPGWLTARAAEVHGLELEVDAARALAGAIGSQLGVLATELEKLAAFVGDRGRATADDVRAVGGYVPRADRWEWFDLVGERRNAEAIAALPALIDAGETGVGLLIGMGAQLLRVGLAVAGGKEALERQLKPYQRWLVGRILPQARLWTLEELDDALTQLLRADRLLKSASLTDRQAMEELLLRLAARHARAAAA